MDIFSICEFKTPADEALADLQMFLSAGMPANVRIGQIRDDKSQPDYPQDPESGLLHVICRSVGLEQIELAEQLIEKLFQYGASWILLDGNNHTPGEICLERGLNTLYTKFVQAGVRSELILRKITEDGPEEGSSEPVDTPETMEELSRKKRRVERETKPDENQSDYLASDLTYKDGQLLTSQQDGVMMDWETPIMKASAELITKPGGAVLNIGFGLGIIDTFIQELGPKTHYICEAHPDVLEKMRADGWYDRPNVVVLEGPWKERLPELIEKGVTLDGIYYDTFSEHYRDMLQLYDNVVGLLEFDGIFSFFNGLGADRQISYDVYKQVVEFDVKDYGLTVEYHNLAVQLPQGTWDSIKRSYFALSEYALPKITFLT